MHAKQLSVFIENRTGRLSRVLQVLADNQVNIISLSLADTTEFGLLRLIVDKPELGREKLTQEGFSSLLSDILIIRIPHKAGSLQGLLSDIEAEGINIEYMYGLSVMEADAHVAMKASDLSKVEEVLARRGVATLSCEAIATL